MRQTLSSKQTLWVCSLLSLMCNQLHNQMSPNKLRWGILPSSVWLSLSFLLSVTLTVSFLKYRSSGKVCHLGWGKEKGSGFLWTSKWYQRQSLEHYKGPFGSLHFPSPINAVPLTSSQIASSCLTSAGEEVKAPRQGGEGCPRLFRLLNAIETLVKCLNIFETQLTYP